MSDVQFVIVCMMCDACYNIWSVHCVSYDDGCALCMRCCVVCIVQCVLLCVHVMVCILNGIMCIAWYVSCLL